MIFNIVLCYLKVMNASEFVTYTIEALYNAYFEMRACTYYKILCCINYILHAVNFINILKHVCNISVCNKFSVFCISWEQKLCINFCII